MRLSTVALRTIFNRGKATGVKILQLVGAQMSGLIGLIVILGSICLIAGVINVVGDGTFPAVIATGLAGPALIMVAELAAFFFASNKSIALAFLVGISGAVLIASLLAITNVTMGTFFLTLAGGILAGVGITVWRRLEKIDGERTGG